jgi:predicted dehydrogenase
MVGEPRTFSIVQYVPMVADLDAQVPPWWFDRARGGGWLGASGSHVVDQVRTWLGEIAAVRATLPVVSARDGGAEDAFAVHLTTRSGASGVLQQTAASWVPHVVGLTVVAGTTGTIELAGDSVFLSDGAGRRRIPVPGDLALAEPPDRSADPRERYTHLELGPYTRLAEVLLAGVEGRPPRTPVAPPTFADGVAGMRVLDAIRASAAAGGTVVAVTG